MPVIPSIGLWYQTINPKSVCIGPCQFNKDWVKHEKRIGIDPQIKARTQFFLELLLARYFWNPINKNICGIQFNKPIKVRCELEVILLIALGSRKFIMLEIKSNEELIKKIKFNLSSQMLSFDEVKLQTSAIIKIIEPNEKAEGNRNKPI